MKLNAGLRILVLPLRAELRHGLMIRFDSDDVDGIYSDDTGLSPFLPERLLGSATSVLGGELGLVESEVHNVGGLIGSSRLWFGHSKGTMDDGPEEPIWSGRSSVCASLWHTDHGPALSLERVYELGEDGIASDDERLEPFRGIDGLRQAMDTILLGTGLTAQSSIASLLGKSDKLRGGSNELSALELYVESPDVVRGTRLTEGLIVQVEPNATKTVSRLAMRGDADNDFDRTFLLQAFTLPWEWNAVPIVQKPVEAGARIAIREDGRYVFLNLEAMSVYHDYDGIGGRHLVVACIPQVTRMAKLAADCASVADILADPSPDGVDVNESGLARLESARYKVESAQKRQILMSYNRKFSHKEKFNVWTQGGQLAAVLSDALAQRAMVMTSEMERMGAVIGRSMDAKIQRTTLALQKDAANREANRRSRILFESVAVGVAALSLLVSLFMTTAAAPAWQGSGTVGMWPWSFLAVGGTIVVGTLLGAIFRKLR